MDTKEKPQSTAKAKAAGRKKTHHHRGLLVVICATVAVMLIAVAAVAPFMLTHAPENVRIRVPRNATISQVDDSLHKYLPKEYADRVMHLLKVRNADLSKRHGEYLISKGMSPFIAMRKIGGGSQTPVTITINHFRDLPTLAHGLSRKADFTAEEFLKVATDSATLAPYGLKPEQALSLFLEDTYEIYWTYTPQEVIEKVGKSYKDFWNPENVKEAADMGVTPAELMIVASITDEETNKPDEKGRIGTLYLNRLNCGMRLQADPTVRFALGNFTIQRVTKEHLKYDSPYNTYRIDGLPPGPIRTTSVKTLQSIIDHESTDDLYMCAKEDFSGYHNFASDYSHHMANALKYQHELDRRGIK